MIGSCGVTQPYKILKRGCVWHSPEDHWCQFRLKQFDEVDDTRVDAPNPHTQCRGVFNEQSLVQVSWVKSHPKVVSLSRPKGWSRSVARLIRGSYPSRPTPSPTNESRSSTNQEQKQRQGSNKFSFGIRDCLGKGESKSLWTLPLDCLGQVLGSINKEGHVIIIFKKEEI